MVLLHLLMPQGQQGLGDSSTQVALTLCCLGFWPLPVSSKRDTSTSASFLVTAPSLTLAPPATLL